MRDENAELASYTRVSNDEQRLSLQLDVVRSSGCRQISRDMPGGAKADEPVLTRALDHACEGKALIVWRLDREELGQVDAAGAC
jgi:DNA invertase Pin-like site-specific DNA recombinase